MPELAENDDTASWDRRHSKGPHFKAFRSCLSCELQISGALSGHMQEQLGRYNLSVPLEHCAYLVPDLMRWMTKQFIAFLRQGARSCVDTVVNSGGKTNDNPLTR